MKILRSTSPLRTAVCVLMFLALFGTSRNLYSDPPKPTIIILVRHANVDSSSGDPGLNAKGKKRAQDLAARLKNSGIQAIFVSRKKRTTETATPLAGTTSPKIPIYARDRGKDNDKKDIRNKAIELAKNIKKYRVGQKILVVGHTENIPTLISEFSGKSIPAIKTFDNLYVVILRPGKAPQLLSEKYGDKE